METVEKILDSFYFIELYTFDKNCVMGLAYKPDIDISKCSEDGVLKTVSLGVVNEIKTKEGCTIKGKINNLFGKVWNIVDFKLNFENLEFRCELENERPIVFSFLLNKNKIRRGTCRIEGSKDIECVCMVKNVPKEFFYCMFGI